MKFAKILRILGIAVILSLLIVAIPAVPALALTYDIELFNEGGDEVEEGAIGEEITIIGTSFGYNVGIERMVRIIFAKDEASKYEDIGIHVDTFERLEWAEIEQEDDGSFETTFEVPDILNDGTDDADVTSGTYYVYVTISSSGSESPDIRAIAEFTVISGEISLDPEEGTVDTLVEISGEYFAADEEILIEYDGDEIDIEDGDDETDSSGDFVTIISIPESTAGTHDITVIIGSSEVEAEFTVESDIILAPQSGEAGTEVTVSGTGFARRPEEVSIYFNNKQEAIEPLDTKGSFYTTFYIPEGLSAGSYTIEAEDGNLNAATAPFTLTVAPASAPPTEPTPTPPPTPTPSSTALSINQSGNTIGSLIGIGGSGFAPNGPVTLKYDDKVVATATTDASGVFVATFQAPPSKHGDHIIIVSDGINTNEVTFTVESVAPEVPTPLLPEMGVKVESPVSFDWEDVTDKSSPVTYALQIATDEDFTADAIVLEKTELAKSEYILTEEEELELAGQEAPYYWRVRAIDAALNEGEWTGAGEIYVAASFGFPRWALYTLLGIGAVIIFAIGYWLGRRTAFYY